MDPTTTRLASASSPFSGYVTAVSHATSPYVTAYTLNFNVWTRLSDPSTLPTGDGQSISLDNEVVAIGHTTSPFVSVYPLTSAGFGVKYTDPTLFSLPASSGYEVALAPGANFLAVGSLTGTSLSIYPFSKSTGFGQRLTYSDFGIVRGLAFSPDGTQFATVNDTSPYLRVYPFSPSTGLGTAYSGIPAAIPGTPLCVAFNKAGTALAVGHNTSPYITVYSWSSSGFGTKFANPALPPRAVTSISFNEDDSAIACTVSGSSPNVYVYQWSSQGFGSVYSTVLNSTNTSDARFTSGGDYLLASANTTTNRISAYPFTIAGGLGARIFPASTPAGACTGICVT